MPVVLSVNSILIQVFISQGLIYVFIMSLHKQNIKESSTAHIFENHYKNMMIIWV